MPRSARTADVRAMPSRTMLHNPGGSTRVGAGGHSGPGRPRTRSPFQQPVQQGGGQPAGEVMGAFGPVHAAAGERAARACFHLQLKRPQRRQVAGCQDGSEDGGRDQAGRDLHAQPAGEVVVAGPSGLQRGVHAGRTQRRGRWVGGRQQPQRLERRRGRRAVQAEVAVATLACGLQDAGVEQQREMRRGGRGADAAGAGELAGGMEPAIEQQLAQSRPGRMCEEECSRGLRREPCCVINLPQADERHAADKLAPPTGPDTAPAHKPRHRYLPDKFTADSKSADATGPCRRAGCPRSRAPRRHGRAAPRSPHREPALPRPVQLDPLPFKPGAPSVWRKA